MTVTPCKSYMPRHCWTYDVPEISEKMTSVEFDDHWRFHVMNKPQLSIARPGGIHPMIGAAQSNNVALIHHFYKRDKTVLDLGNVSGWTPLMWAVFADKLAAAEALLGLGAEVNVSTIDSYLPSKGLYPKGITCLWIAVKAKNVAIAKFLLKYDAIAEPKLDVDGEGIIAQAKEELAKERIILSTAINQVTSVFASPLLQLIVEYV